MFLKLFVVVDLLIIRISGFYIYILFKKEKMKLMKYWIDFFNLISYLIIYYNG